MMSDSNEASGVAALSDSNRFVAWFVLGAFLMLLLKVFTGASQVVVTLAPAIVMGIYFYQLWLQTKFSISSEKAGDNVYYLGFLFTLCSLGLALYEFGSNVDNKASLIGDFAIALTTTILGVLGRVWLGQGEKQVDDYEREARASMTEAMDALRGELDQSRESLAGFAVATREILEQSRETYREQMEADRQRLEKQFVSSLEDMSKTLGDAVKEGADSITGNFELLSNGISAQVSTFQTSVDTMKSLSDSLVTVLNEALTSFQNLPDLQEIISERMGQLVEPVTVAANAMEEALQSQADLLKSLPESMRDLNSATASANKEIDSLGGAVKTFIESLDSARDSQATSLKGVETVVTALASTLTGIDEGIAKLASAPNTIAAQLESVERGLKGLEQGIAKSSSLIEQSSDSSKDMIEKVVGDRQQVLDSLSASNTVISAQASALAEQIAVVSEALIAAAKFIRSETSQAN